MKDIHIELILKMGISTIKHIIQEVFLNGVKKSISY